MLSWIFLSGFVLISSITILFTMPSELQDKLISEIQSKFTLQSQKYNDWAILTSNQDREYKRTFQIFNLKSGNNLNGKTIDLDLTQEFHYNASISLINTTYLVNTNNDISYLLNKSLDADDDSISTQQMTQVNHINLGLQQNWQQIQNTPLERRFVLEFYNIIKYLRFQYLPEYFSEAVMKFYVGKDGSFQNLVNQTIFMKNQLLNYQQSDLLFNDPKYGWKNQNTLSFWVQIILSQKFENDTNWIILQKYFDLQQNQMQKLVGNTSVLNQAYNAIQGKLADTYGCDKRSYCSLDYLVALQWSSFGLSQNPIIDGMTPQLNVSVYNSTFPSIIEIATLAQTEKFQGILLSTDQAMILIQRVQETDITPKKSSLLSFKNVQYLIDNANTNKQAITKLFGGITDQQIDLLIGYIQYVDQNITKSYNPELQAISLVSTQIFQKPLLDINDNLLQYISQLGMNQQFIQQNTTCDQIFNSTQLQNLTNLCFNDLFNPVKSVNGNYYYVKLQLEGLNSSFAKSFSISTNIQMGQLDFMLNDNQSIYNVFYVRLMKSLSQQFKCKNSNMCQKQELVVQQWCSSYVTLNLPQDIFSQVQPVHSISEWVQDIKFSPELSAFANKIGQIITLNQSECDQFLSYDQGGLQNKYENRLFLDYLEQNDSQNLLKRFGTDLQNGHIISKYLDYLVFDIAFGGLVIQRSVYEILWGYQDSYLTMMQRLMPLEGGTPDLENQVSYFQINNQKEQSLLNLETQYNQKNTGISNSNDLRSIRKIYGQSQIASLRQFQNSKNSLELNFITPYDQSESIHGCDEFGFQIQPGTFIYLFDDYLLRNLQLQQISSYSEDKFNVIKYQINQNETCLNPRYFNQFNGVFNTTSVQQKQTIATSPMFRNCDSQLYQDILLNNQSFDKYQPAYQDSFFVLESQSGITYQFQKNLQHSQIISGRLAKKYNKTNIIVPLIIESQQMKLSQDKANQLFSFINDENNNIKQLKTYLTIISILFLLNFGFLAYLHFRSPNKNQDDQDHYQKFKEISYV